MSWNKNTINFSSLNAIKQVLDDLRIEYTLEVKERVIGQGNNDEFFGENPYELRRLSYRGFVVLEQIQKTSDCDSDDMIISQKFTRETEPKVWQYIVNEEDETQP